MNALNGVPWEWLWLLVYSGAAVTAMLHALLHAQDARAAWGWMAVCLLFPFIGAVLYYVLGINRIRPVAGGRQPPEAAALLPEDRLDDTPLRGLARIGTTMSGRALTPGNRIEPLENGENAYPAMRAAIEAAQHRVDLMTYIFVADDEGRRFIEALAAAHRRGVQVRVLVDGVADLIYWPRASRALKRAGVPHARFHPLRLWPPMLHANLRNHRKLLVVDGEQAFTGGMNIAAYHRLDGQHRKPVADLHFAVSGPLVAELAEVFEDDWQRATGQRAPALPAPPPKGEAIARVLTDGPDDPRDPVTLVLLSAIGAATRRICAMTPYFLPPHTVLAALQAAALRGVQVHLLLPARSNHRSVDHASRHLLPALLACGVRVAYQGPPFVHTKLLVVDGHYVQFGSANLDARSLRLNFELNVEVFDDGLARRLEAFFDRAWHNARPERLEALEGRPLAPKLRDAAYWLFSPYL